MIATVNDDKRPVEQYLIAARTLRAFAVLRSGEPPAAFESTAKLRIAAGIVPHSSPTVRQEYFAMVYPVEIAEALGNLYVELERLFTSMLSLLSDGSDDVAQSMAAQLTDARIRRTRQAAVELFEYAAMELENLAVSAS